MRCSSLLFMLIFLSTVQISGCFDGGFELDDPKYKYFDTVSETVEGSGYLDEFTSESVFTLDIEDGEHIQRMVATLKWIDEEPVDRARQYVNEGDQFTIRITDGGNVTRLGTATNAPEFEGIAICYYLGDVVYSETTHSPVRFSLEITLVNAGDQYAYLIRDEATKVEDTGNDFYWQLDYTLLIEI